MNIVNIELSKARRKQLINGYLLLVKSDRIEFNDMYFNGNEVPSIEHGFYRLTSDCMIHAASTMTKMLVKRILPENLILK